MLIDYLEGHFLDVIKTLKVIGLCWVAVFFAVILDLFHGIKKAKELGEATTSEGLKRTIKKIGYYYSVMLFALLFDSLDVITPFWFDKPLALMPFASLVSAIGLIITELISVREKADEKARRRADRSFMELAKFIKNREDTAQRLLDKLEETTSRNEKN